MDKKRIVSIGQLPQSVRGTYEPTYEVVSVGDASRQEVLDVLNDQVVAIIARGSVMVDGEMMDHAPNLQLVARTGVGYDTVSIPDATARGLPVVYTPGAMTRAVAEHTLSLIFGAYKRLYTWKEALISGDWDARYSVRSLDLEGAVLGIIGYGRIGRQLRLLASGFDLTVLADDPYIDHSQFASDNVRFVGLEELLQHSDIISLHVPLTEETHHLINHNNIFQFKPGSMLVNTARGGVVESLDLLFTALEEGRLGAVGLDVFPEEPTDPNHPLLHHPRAYCTGHVSARTPLAQKRILETMVQEVSTLLNGGRPNLQNIVNPEVFNKG